MEDSLKKKMVPLSKISSSLAYKNLLKTQMKFSQLTSVSELSPIVRVGSSKTKLFHYYLLLEVGCLLQSMKVTSHKGQMRSPAISKEFNMFFSPIF